MLDIVVERTVERINLLSIENEARNERHILVNHAFVEKEVVVEDELAARDVSPRAVAVHNKAFLPVFLAFADGGDIYTAKVLHALVEVADGADSQEIRGSFVLF